VDDLAFHAGRLVVLQEQGRDLLIVQTHDPLDLFAPPSPPAAFPGSRGTLAPSPGTSFVALGTSAGQIHWVDLAPGGAEPAVLDSPDLRSPEGLVVTLSHRGGVDGLTFVRPDLLLSGSKVREGEGEGELRYWRLRGAGPPELSHVVSVRGGPVSILADQQRGLVAILYQDGVCEVWGIPPAGAGGP
jgi:hypothetical protein